MTIVLEQTEEISIAEYDDKVRKLAINKILNKCERSDIDMFDDDVEIVISVRQKLPYGKIEQELESIPLETRLRYFDDIDINSKNKQEYTTLIFADIIRQRLNNDSVFVNVQGFTVVDDE